MLLARSTSASSIANTSSTTPVSTFERWLDCLAAIDRHVTVQHLLKHLHIGDQPLPGRDRAFHEALRIDPMRMRDPDEVHQDVRVEEDQPRDVSL